MQLRTSNANLADFDNFFDTGDTLSGTGSGALRRCFTSASSLEQRRHQHRNLRYRNLPIGTTVASWSSVRGARGRFARYHRRARCAAFARLDRHRARAQLLRNTIRDSDYNVTAQLVDVDLSTWIAALGAPQVAVTGRVGANATLSGRWPYPHLKGNAELDNGTVWRFPIDKATATLSTSGQRVLLNSATVTSPGITAEAYGSMGFSMEQPLQFTLHASSSDLPRLAVELWRRQLAVSGSFESTLTLGGTPANPTVNATFDGTNTVLYGVSVPSLHGAIALQRHNAVLHDASITLPKGVIAITGSAPIEINPFAIGPRNAPVSVNLTAKDVDPSAFDALLGNNTKLGGTIAGDLGISGTVAQPQISGRFSISKGEYVSDLSRTPITGIEAQIAFNHTTATVNKLQGNFGTGTIVSTGSFTFGPQPTYLVNVTAKGAQLNLPAYGNGTIDGALALLRNGESHRRCSVARSTFSNATIPFSAFVAATQNGTLLTKLPPLDLDVALAIGKNVRVRGSGFGAGLDIGATGSAAVERYARRTDDGRHVLGNQRNAHVLRPCVPRPERARHLPAGERRHPDDPRDRHDPREQSRSEQPLQRGRRDGRRRGPGHQPADYL